MSRRWGCFLVGFDTECYRYYYYYTVLPNNQIPPRECSPRVEACRCSTELQAMSTSLGLRLVAVCASASGVPANGPLADPIRMQPSSDRLALQFRFDSHVCVANSCTLGKASCHASLWRAPALSKALQLARCPRPARAERTQKLFGKDPLAPIGATWPR